MVDTDDIPGRPEWQAPPPRGEGSERLLSSGARAIYHDGHLASDRDVLVRVEGETLVISDWEGEVLGRWVLSDLVLAGGTRATGHMRLRHTGRHHVERLTLLDRAFIMALTDLAPHLSQDDRIVDLSRLRFVFGLMMTMLGTLGVVFFLLVPVFASSLVRLVPQPWEGAIGARIEEALIGAYAKREKRRAEDLVCDGVVGQQVLQSMFDRLVPAAGIDGPVKVTVLDINDTNAFALPGRRVLIFKGLFNFARSGDEVAGVVAHELMHVAARHPGQKLFEGGATTVLLNALFGDFGGRSLASSVGEMLLNAQYSRGMEVEADLGAVRVLHRAGLDPRALGDFLDRVALASQGRDESLTWLQSHPVSRDRARSVRGLAQSLVAESRIRPRPLLSDAEFLRLGLICSRDERPLQGRLPRKRR